MPQQQTVGEDRAEAARRAEELDGRAMAALAAPIDPRWIRTRPGQGGRELRFVQVPAVIERLNEVLGPTNWETEVEVYPDCMRCRLKITLPSGRVLSRDGIGGYPEGGGTRGISEEDRPKGAQSDAMKRAAVAFGIAADLYLDEHAPQRDDRRGSWGSGQPAQPSHREPNGQRPVPPPQRAPQRPEPARTGGGLPEFRGNNGRALFAWAREHDQLRSISAIGKQIGAPDRLVDWTEDEVQRAYAILTGGPGSDDHGDAYEEALGI